MTNGVRGQALAARLGHDGDIRWRRSANGSSASGARSDRAGGTPTSKRSSACTWKWPPSMSGGAPTRREDARRAAVIRFGGIAQGMEAVRDQRGLPWLTDLARDLRYGLRALRRNPMFAAVAVLTLALGIGANTAIFSLADAVLLRTLPVSDPRDLVVLRQRGPAGTSSRSRPPPPSISP